MINLVALCSLFVAQPSVNKTVKLAEETSAIQAFMEDRLKGSVSIMSPLAKNKLPLFSFKSNPVMRAQKGNIQKLHEFKTEY